MTYIGLVPGSSVPQASSSSSPFPVRTTLNKDHTPTYVKFCHTTETAFYRVNIDESHLFKTKAGDEGHSAVTSRSPPPAKKSWISSLALFSGTYTSESLLKMFLRPFGLFLLPAVAWATLTFSVTIGFLVAITTYVNAYPCLCRASAQKNTTSGTLRLRLERRLTTSQPFSPP